MASRGHGRLELVTFALGRLRHRGKRAREEGGTEGCLNSGQVRVEVQQILELRSTYLLL